jgi:Domain of Unknown Function with PDB structure (DUF3857)/Transglutaminase-like superfamily
MFHLEDSALANLLRRCVPHLLFLVSIPAFAQGWIQPTPEELKMTVESAAPDSAAIYLLRDERADDKLHMHSLYVRMKVLTEAGKKYADVELVYDQGRSFSIRAIDGRTIHSDGTVIPFTGKPYDKVLEKTKAESYKAKVFTLPDVQVGSILEYRYVLAYDDDWVLPPQWYIQQPLYVRKAHYLFIPSDRTISDSHGGGSENLAYTPSLPQGVEVKESLAPTTRVGGQEHSYSLDVENIAPIPEEEFMPPMRSVSYRVLFYYTNIRTTQEYWKTEGKYWSHEIDSFMSPNKLGGIVGGIVAPSDTPTQKAQKIYNAVMTLENTSFTRGHSRAEDKAQGIKIKTAEDIWAVKRGSGNEIALLYVALARAAGLQAYAAEVTNRDEAFFVPIFLSMDQLDDDLAIVVLDGKEQFLDPGERYCAFGDLHWKHTMTGGLRQTDHGTELMLQTTSPGYKTTTVLRAADLYLDLDGKLHGTLRLTMTGSEALYWRQRALTTDEDAVKKEFEGSVQSTLPPGVEVKTDHFIGLTDYGKNLLVAMAVSGSMGTSTSKRVFLPTLFFEAGSKPLFVHEKRTVPVDLRYAYGAQDTVVIHLPATWTVESAPKDVQIPLPKNALYQTTVKQEPGKLEIGRVFILANSIYMVDKYGELKDFYQKVNARDQEQAVLQPTAATTAQSGGAK